MNNIKSISASSGNGKQRKEKRVSVEEISNGFIITENIEYTDKNGIWQYKTTKTYSEKNPFAKSSVKELADFFD